MTTAWRHQVSLATSVGGVYSDVSEDRLEALVESLADRDEFEFVICERSGYEGSYAQAVVPGTQIVDGRLRVVGRKKFVVEYRDRDHTNHWQAETDDISTVAQVIAGWAFDRPGWKDLVSWKKVDLPS